MKILEFTESTYKIPYVHGVREGLIFEITDESGRKEKGEIAPLPKWSHETLDQAVSQFKRVSPLLKEIEWTEASLGKLMLEWELYPSVQFGIESAILSLLAPVPSHNPMTSCLLLGNISELRHQALQRKADGFKTAKIKVSQLSFKEAFEILEELKSEFMLRVDVNRAWENEAATKFFSRFKKSDFEYVEEPFRNPKELSKFPLPFAVDESFPGMLSFKEMETLPLLKAVVYKPTMQGGFFSCLPILEWTKKNCVELVLSSSFESPVGLRHIASMAKRLNLKSPLGLGTAHHMQV